MSKRKKKLLDEQETIAFQFCEQMQDMIRDLENLDRMIPSESCRHGALAAESDKDAAFVIEARKNDFLRYIQSICRDHIHYGKLLTERGWTVEQWGKKKKKKGARRG